MYNYSQWTMNKHVYKSVLRIHNDVHQVHYMQYLTEHCIMCAHGLVLRYCTSMTCINPINRSVLEILFQHFLHTTVTLTMSVRLSIMVEVNNWLKAERLYLNVSITFFIWYSQTRKILLMFIQHLNSLLNPYKSLTLKW